MDKIRLIVVGLAVFTAWLIFKYLKNRNAEKAGLIPQKTNTGAPPSIPRPNDKLVIISNTNYTVVKTVLTDFSKLYNKQFYLALPRLTNLTETQFAVTFPFDVSFEVFVYFINYLQYPIDVEWAAEATGWATTKTGDEWATGHLLNKKVMLFVPKNEKTGEAVYVTTQDGYGFVFNFAADETTKQLKTPARTFALPPITINQLIEMPGENFK